VDPSQIPFQQPLAAAATVKPTPLPDPYAPENVGKTRAFYEQLFGKVDQSRTHGKAERILREIEAQNTGRKKLGHMLSAFGFGMASSQAPSFFGQIGAGGLNMVKDQQERDEQMRKNQLALLGVDVKLDDQVQENQQKIAQATATAVNQAARLQAAKEKLGNFAPTDRPILIAAGVDLNDPDTWTQANMSKFMELKTKEEAKLNARVTIADRLHLTGTDRELFLRTGKPGAVLSGQFAVAARKAGLDPNRPLGEYTAEEADKVWRTVHPQVEFTEEQYEQLADDYRRTRKLPALGPGISGAKARQEILARAANQASAENTTLSESIASGQADASSLKKVTQMLDAVTSFENTANANLDIYLQAAKRLYDTNSPLLNKPLREIDEKVLGSEDLAALRAARNVAFTEVAKVTNNPNLSGQLPVTARNEVFDLAGENATLGQIYRVAQVLKTDMANRHRYLDQQNEAVKTRLGGGRKPGSPATTTPAAPAAGTGMTRTATKDGRKARTTDGGKTWYWVDTGEQVQ